MGKKKEESQKTEETEEQKVWKCQRCGTVLEIPLDFSDEELKELEEKGELFCTACQYAREVEEEGKKREKTVFKGELTLKRETWKPLLKYAKRLLKEVTFRINTNTVKVQEMTDDRIAMLKGVIKTENLTEFTEKKQPDKLFRVDLATFCNAVRQAGYPATVKSDGNALYFENGWGDYRMPLLGYDLEQYPIPKVKFTAQAKIDIGEIFDKLKWIHEKPDGVTLIAKDGKLRIKLGNGVGERLEAEIGECEGEAKVSYPLEYLKAIKEQYSYEKWDVEFGNEIPLHAQKTKRVGERDSVQFDFYLAPRIEEI